MNYSAGFPFVSYLKCALREPCADPARGRVENSDPFTTIILKLKPTQWTNWEPSPTAFFPQPPRVLVSPRPLINMKQVKMKIDDHAKKLLILR